MTSMICSIRIRLLDIYRSTITWLSLGLSSIASSGTVSMVHPKRFRMFNVKAVINWRSYVTVFVSRRYMAIAHI
jgi:hypothetical protein